MYKSFNILTSTASQYNINFLFNQWNLLAHISTSNTVRGIRIKRIIVVYGNIPKERGYQFQLSVKWRKRFIKY